MEIKTKFQMNDKVEYKSLIGTIQGIKICLNGQNEYYVSLGLGNNSEWIKENELKKESLISYTYRYMLKQLLIGYTVDEDAYVDDYNILHINAAEGGLSIPVGKHKMELWKAYKLEELL